MLVVEDQADRRDYLTKPFGSAERLARVATLLRRHAASLPASRRTPHPSPSRWRWKPRQRKPPPPT